MTAVQRQVDLRVRALGKARTLATAPPAVTSDSAHGYAPNDTWVDTAANLAYICVDAAVGAAVWTALAATLSVASVSVDPTATIDQGTTYARAT